MMRNNVQKKTALLLYTSHLRAITRLPTKEAMTTFLDGIADYQDSGGAKVPDICPDAEPALTILFDVILQHLDFANSKYAERCAKSKAAAIERWRNSGAGNRGGNV